MSLIAYLCWVLGISVPGTCDPTAYGNVALEACSMDTDPGNTLPEDRGEKNTPPHHSRGTNIDVSI